MKNIKKHKKHLAGLFSIILLVFYSLQTPFALSSCSKKVQPDTLVFFSYNQLQKLAIEKLVNKNYYSFNGAILVGQKDSVFYQKALGFANYKNKDSITLNTSFQLASVSKQFTAVAILQLYEKNLLKLSDSIQRFFPNFPYKGITVHQLLVHRSGLPNYHYFLQHIPTTADTLITNTQVVTEIISKQPAAYYRPNQRYHYSNTGYALLAAIVEKISGLPFEEYLQAYIFEPLKMNNSFAYRGDGILPENKPTATGYLRKWRPAEDNYLDGVLGDKGVYSSANDLFIWDQALYKGSIINVDTLKKAFKPMGKPLRYKTNYGYGWRIFNWKVDSTQTLYHAGWWHGFKTMLIRIPKDTTTIVILKNCSTGKQFGKKTLLNILYPQTNIQKDSLTTDTLALSRN